jgi:hypothetical protein
MVNNYLCFFERDNAQKQTYAGRNRELQILWNGIDDVLPYRKYRNQKKQNTGAEHRGERLLPRIIVGQHNGESEECVDAHARRERDGIIGVECHDQSADCGCKAGGNKNRPLIHSGLAEDDGVDEHDVNHRQKRGYAGHEFRADVRPLPGKPKIPIQQC